MRMFVAAVAASLSFSQSTFTSANQPDPCPDCASAGLPDQFADIDDSVRFVPSTRPAQPDPQRPPRSTPENVDTGRNFSNWQRLTDDWFGVRPALDDRGISVALSATADYSRVVGGGVNTEDDDFAYLINLNTTFDLERLLNWKGGTFFFNFQENGGTDVVDNAGNYLGITNIAADNRTQISEIWFEQFLFGDGVRIKVGKIDVNGEFAASEYAAEFLNPSAELPPNLLGLPSYPDPAFGGLLSWQVCEGFGVAAGVFDGAGQEGYTTGDDGPSTLFGDPADLYLVSEAALSWECKALAGRLALGATRHTGTFDRFDGETEDGVNSYYAVFDHAIFKEEPDDADDIQGAGVFARITFADADYSEVTLHAAAGGTWRGPLTGRDDDTIGLAVYYAKFTDRAAAGFDDDGEFALEAFYKLQLTPFASIKPDLQYIANPSGSDEIDDALVASVRFSLEF
jgi:porin